jgi:O-antigen/teichoic acid export membrane protein
VPTDDAGENTFLIYAGFEIICCSRTDGIVRRRIGKRKDDELTNRAIIAVMTSVVVVIFVVAASLIDVNILPDMDSPYYRRECKQQ